MRIAGGGSSFLRLSSVFHRTSVFALVTSVLLAAFWRVLNEIFSLSLRNGYGSYIVLIPVFSIYVIWSRRQQVFRNLRYDVLPGLLTIAAGIALLAVVLSKPFATFNSFMALDLRYLSLLVCLSGLFLIMYGRHAMRRALFPFALLVLSTPLPASLADKVIAALQTSSTALAYSLFSLLGTPVYRDGFLLRVPGATIEVAKECSGINSSMALVFTLLLVGYETLRTASRRFILLLLAVPLSIAKNAIRIVTLTLLAVHVDKSFLTGNLHHKGGIVFYLIGLAALYPAWKLLQRSERPNVQTSEDLCKHSTQASHEERLA